MGTITITAEDFESTVLAEGITLVDWWAAWCGPCRMFAPVFEQASEQRMKMPWIAAKNFISA